MRDGDGERQRKWSVLLIEYSFPSPSTSPDEHVEHADGEYLAAEQMGRRREPCDQVFRECPVSVLDKFSGLYNTMEGLMNWMG